MRVMNMKKAISQNAIASGGMLMAALLFVPAASAAVPGITGPNFNLRRARNTSASPTARRFIRGATDARVAPAGFAPCGDHGHFLQQHAGAWSDLDRDARADGHRST